METPIEYLEKPATADERQVALLLENMIKAISGRDFNLLASLFSVDASIIMFADDKRALSKKEYMKEVLKNIEKVRFICYKNVFIRVTSNYDATAICLKDLTSPGDLSVENKISERVFRFCKKNGRWYIVEATYSK